MKSICVAVLSLCLLPVAALAQSSSAGAQPVPNTVWLELNIGIAKSAQESLVSRETSVDSFGETREGSVTYSWPRGVSIDFGGGLMFSRIVGVGLSVSGTAHQAPADLFVRLPHPNFFNRYASDQAETDEDFTKAEGAVHLSAVFVPVNTSSIQLKVFGGPTYFRLEADALDNIRFTQATLGTLNAVDITTYDSSTYESSGYGFHLGADLGLFVTKNFGFGAGVRYSKGSVDWVDGLGPGQKIDVGGTRGVVGLRLRF